MCKRLSFVLFVACLISLTGAAATTAQAQEMSLDGLSFNNVVNADLSKDDLKGKVVLVEFWGTK